MDFEVRAVSGIESCFVSLPVSFIQILQSTGGGSIPPLLALELRSRSGVRWSVAWSGSASGSSAIEVSKQLAECISLPDSIEVQVKVVSSLQKAVEVSIEPSTEDDWEVLELNSDLAEDAILKQVGIVHEGVKFPLWLHGHKVVMFHVISTFPKNAVVQLVPGTEVIVAPKLRRKDTDSHQNIKQQSCRVEFQMKTPLRVQLMKKVVAHQFDFLGVEIGVVLTTAAFIHPETAHKLSLGNNQFVKILPKLPVNEKPLNHKDIRRNTSSAAEGNLGSKSLINEAPRQTVVHLLYSESAARGHIMLPHSLCLFLKAGVHSWVYVEKASITPKKNASVLTIAPCRFKFHGKNSKKNKALNELDSFKDFKNKTSSSKSGAEMLDWSLHVKLLSSLSREYPQHENGEAAANFNVARRKDYLLSAWVVGQLKAITSHAGEVDICSVVLAHETLLQFDVTCSKSGNLTNEHPSSSVFFKKGDISAESHFEIMYILSAKFEESSSSYLQDFFELSIKTENKSMGDVEGLELDLGDPISLESAVGKELDRIGSSVSSLSWLETASMDAINRLKILLSSTSGKFLSSHHLPLPGHVLLHGPPGSGKTSLAMAVANCLEGHAEILAHIVFINCSKLALEKSQAIRQSLSAYLSEALAHVPSLLIFDDLDHVASSSSEFEGSQSSNSALQLVEYLIDIMDEYGARRQTSCGIGPIAFMATALTLGNLPQSLTSSGRFDFHVQLSAPAVSERGAILKHEIKKRSLQCSADVLSDVASKCDGYDSYDLEILVDRAVHAAIGRYLNTHTKSNEKKPLLIKDDFSKAMLDFTPVAMRGLTKAASQGGRSGWDDVGGLLDIRNAIQEMVEMPSKFPTIFSQAPLRLRSNVLLYGPPGCGKTHIVGAAAAACSLRFISVKGPELLNKYIGASEQAVRDMFSKAAAAAPCLLFFDEFDSIAPKRGHDNTGVTDRVVNQLLTELDGVEALTGVFVFAATSRPDLLDAALLRPGRLDRLLFCNFPTRHERLDILMVLSKKLPMASDVNLDVIASMTDGFSGADLQALLSDAQLASVHEILDNVDFGAFGKGPVISDELLRSVASKARPSVSESEKKRLYGIYNQFLDSKKSVNAQSRDAKGKRATLA